MSIVDGNEREAEARRGLILSEAMARRWAVALGVAVFSFAAVTSLAWVTGFTAFRELVPGIDMKLTTSLAFVVVGVGLIGANASRSSASLRTAQVCGALVALLGIEVLIEYATGKRLQLEQVLGGAPADLGGNGNAARLASNTAAAFVAIGVALMFVRSRPRWAHAAALIAVAIGLLGGIDYFLDGGTIHIAHFRQMAISTAIAFLVSAAAVFVSMPGTGVARLFALDGIAGSYARRVLPATMLITLVLAYVRVMLQREGWFDLSFGVSLMAMVSIIVTLVVGLWGAEIIERAAARERALRGQRDIAHRQLESANRELEAAIRELQSSKGQLEVANGELESFSYSVSHDLRSPLRAIDGFAAILEEDHRQALNADAQALLARIRAAAARMGALIDGLLELSGMSRGRLAVGTVDLSAVAAEVCADLGRADPVPTELQIQPGLTAKGDARLLRAVLQNLLANAFKFSSKKPKRVIEFGRDGTGPMFVRDNGAGFDPAYAEKLFGAFQRLHRVDEFEGTGIGLATCQRIIQRHGGRIWAVGRPDEGATVFFTLPAAAALANG